VAYQSLYRRHRPLTFADMTGQEHITRTLGNALSSGRLAHAYLFCGPRGTGKTTVAKILARAVNCEKYPAPEPCGSCSACKNIGAGVSMDVIEMDAASNRGIDEIRELRERTRYASGEYRCKVYIIDEAHMLTVEACNAFLKTLEEPPQNVIFILATTDPSRLPSTIVSRCQRFDFHLLTVDQIYQRIEHVIKQENRRSDREAVRLMARLADGSLRDALGILEQCSAYSEEQITAEHVRIVTGATRTETIEAMIKAAVENDPDSGLEIIEQLVYGGRDLQLLMRDLTFIFSRLLLFSETKSATKQKGNHGFEKILDNYRGKIPRDLLLEGVELLHEMYNELRHAHFPQFILEVAFVRLLRLLHGRPETAPLLQAETEVPVEIESPARIKEEEKASVSAGTELDKTTGNTVAEDFESEPLGQKYDYETTEAAAESDPVSKLREDWPRIIQELKKKQKSTAAWLEPARLKDFRGRLIFLTYAPEYSIHQLRIMENGHRKLVEEVLSDFCRMPVDIKAEIKEEESEAGKDSAASVSSLSPDSTGRQQGTDQIQADEGKKHKATSAEEARKLFGGKLIDPD